MEELKNIIKQELAQAYEDTLGRVQKFRSVGYYEYVISTYSIERIYENAYNNLETLHSDNLENKDSQELLKELYIQKAQTDILLLVKEMEFNTHYTQQGRLTPESTFQKYVQELLAKYE